ncbi:hypothetical protein JOC77_001655 [Peribacillus deserti]|uniref:DUF2306 domain-containing protein n=1 Tax=Peribacillus deserti TaxID=673318 RepID=A0ABS2QI79_9BACI|nr:hypothetical protein [Peribacillus deserti]MBM7692228.1 hypothetical protein [Peribacillus deserti]
MLRNTVIAFFIHIFTGVIIWLSGNYFYDFVFNKYQSNAVIMNSYLLCVSIIGLTVYYILGRKLLRFQGSKLKSLLSVSLVSLIGFIIGLYLIIFTNDGWDWIMYILYNAALHPAMMVIANTKYALWLSILPSLFMWMGIVHKEKSNMLSQVQFFEEQL